ncbi:MAG: hypothetical protein JWM53_3075, partial [bacterium]|nr:hypothetical protein [bacterium]
ELDETGFSYYGARYASAALGRWTGRDPAYLLQPGTFGQRANLYAFDDNNPVSRVDGDGRDPKTPLESHYYVEPGWLRQHYDYYANLAHDTSMPLWARTVAGVEAASTLIPAAAEEMIRGVLLVPHDADMAAQMAAAATVERNTFEKADLIAGALGHGSAALGNLAVAGEAVVVRELAPGAAAAKDASGSALPKLGEPGGPKIGSAGGPGAGKRFADPTKNAAEAEAKGRCVFCGEKTTRTPGPLQRNTDHAIAKSRGGNNTLENAENTCRTCNLDKRAQSTEEYLKKRAGGQ